MEDFFWNFLCNSNINNVLSKLKKLSLKRLKEFANILNYHHSWGKIGNEFKNDLINELFNNFEEIYLLQEKVIDTKNTALESFYKRIKIYFKTQFKNDMCSEERLRQSYDSCVHILPSGSGCVIKIKDSFNVLTCAHCIDTHEDDKENNNGEQRLNKYKIIIWADGSLGLAKCVIAIDRTDVALLEIIYRQQLSLPLINMEHSCVKKDGPPTINTKVACIHFPNTPFTTAGGCIKGFRKGDKTDSSILGATIHTVNTYWGTSGASLFDYNGEIVAIHNSFYNGQRHACSYEAICLVINTYLISLNN